MIWEGIEIPKVRKPFSKEISSEKKLNIGGGIVVNKEEKEKPAERSVDVNSQSFIKDMHAYFKGLSDGRDLSLQDILQLESENKTSEQLSP